MLFNSATFLVFILGLLPLYALCRGDTARKALLLIASYLFYANWDPRFLLLLLGSTCVDFAAARRIYAAPEGSNRRRAWLLLSLLINLGALAVFKYGHLFLATVGWDSLAVHLPQKVPVGISFYTFQTLSYTIDVYRRTERPCPSLLEFAMFVAFFPQLVAGPIVRSREFLPQVHRLPAFTADGIAAGVPRFVLGLFKKVVIADNVGVFVDSVFLFPGHHDAITLWCAAYGFALQIYCDFSAYTDMAIGCSRAFGIRLPENFDAPYLSRSITEFWRRWHQSLSRWLRDYLYIPLGGSRGGRLATYRNLMLTMLLGGLWHGAAWTMVVWGGFHGALLAIERALGIGRETQANALRRQPIRSILASIVTFHLVCIAWVMFRAKTFPLLRTYLERMFTEWHLLPLREFLHGMLFDWNLSEPDPKVLWTRVILALAATQWLTRRFDIGQATWDRTPTPIRGLALALLLVAASLFHVDEVAFIYFQF